MRGLVCLCMVLGVGLGAVWSHQAKADWHSNPDARMVIDGIKKRRYIRSRKAIKYLKLHPQWANQPEVLNILKVLVYERVIGVLNVLDAMDDARRSGELKQVDDVNLRYFLGVAIVGSRPKGIAACIQEAGKMDYEFFKQEPSLEDPQARDLWEQSVYEKLSYPRVVYRKRWCRDLIGQRALDRGYKKAQNIKAA